MGKAWSLSIFLSKMSNLMSVLEYVRTYIDEPLGLTKDLFDDHV